MLAKDTIVTLRIRKEDNHYAHEKIDPNSPQICLYDALRHIADENQYALHDLVFHNIPIRDRLRELGLRALLDELKYIHPLDNLDDIFNSFYKMWNDVVLSNFDIQLYRIDEVVSLWGQEIGNYERIKNSAEICSDHGGAYRIKDECDVDWDYHVGEISQPYPCFDSEDWANEDRYYQNFIIRQKPITEEEMKSFYELAMRGNYSRLHENTPEDMLPILYYKGDGDFMLVGTKKLS